MRVIPHDTARGTFLECDPAAGQLATDGDAVELVSACAAHDASRLLLHGTGVVPAFFDLGTGVAGQLLHRFGIYRVRVAVLLAPGQVLGRRFHELVTESNKGTAFAAFFDRADAENWLLRD